MVDSVLHIVNRIHGDEACGEESTVNGFDGDSSCPRLQRGDLAVVNDSHSLVAGRPYYLLVGSVGRLNLGGYLLAFTYP